MKKLLTIITTGVLSATPIINISQFWHHKLQDDNVDSETFNLNTNSQPGQTDIGWNKFLNDGTGKTRLLGKYNQIINNNSALINGENYTNSDYTSKEITPHWAVGGGIFLDNDNNDANHSYINTPEINKNQGLFGSYNFIHSYNNNAKIHPNYENTIYTHTSHRDPADQAFFDDNQYNLNNFTYENYTSATSSNQINAFNLTPSYISGDDSNFNITKGVYISQSKLFINHIFNDFLHIWYFDTWASQFQSDFTSDNTAYYNLSLYDKLKDKLINDVADYGWLNKLYFHLSINYNYIKDEVHSAHIPAGASLATEVLGGLVDSIPGVDGLGWIAGAIVDMFLDAINNQTKPTEENNAIFYNSSDNLTYPNMIAIFNDLLGTPDSFYKGDYSKPIASFEHKYGHFPGQINLNNFNVFLNVNKFITNITSDFGLRMVHVPSSHTYNWNYYETFIDQFNPQTLIPNLNLNITLSRSIGDIGKIFSELNKYYFQKHIFFHTWQNSDINDQDNNFLMNLINGYKNLIPNINALNNFRQNLTFTDNNSQKTTTELPMKFGVTKIVQIHYKNEIIARVKLQKG